MRPGAEAMRMIRATCRLIPLWTFHELIVIERALPGLDAVGGPVRPVLEHLQVLNYQLRSKHVIEAKGREHLQAESTRIGTESKLVESIREVSYVRSP